LTESYLNNDSTGVDFQHMARIHMIATQDGKVRVIGDSQIGMILLLLGRLSQVS